MTRRKIIVDVGSIEDVAAEFIEVWHRAEAGKYLKRAKKISFENERLEYLCSGQGTCT